MTLSQLQTHRDAILAAIVGNKLSVSFNGRNITYRSVQEMKDALQVIDGEIVKQQNSSAGGSFSLGGFRRGS